MEQLRERVEKNMRPGGVWARSSSETYFIYCVGQDLIKQKAFTAWAYNNEVGCKPLLGMYKGQSEQSYISNWKDYKKINPWLVSEESILILGACNSDNEPKASLFYLQSNEYVDLGHLKSVPRDEALLQDAWTFDPFTQNYYICL
ncbi:hypothetical protein ACGYLM_01430 [Sulfitobacter sp. 1A10445]|uniref:hypothetical protein n=1 Tax=unclassified Sulfitobacter TaxID=196795 RepID=UPI0037461682